MTGIFLLHAFKDVKFSLSDLPKFSKKNSPPATNNESVKYTKFERQKSDKRIEELANAEERIRMYGDNAEDDSAVLLIESLASETQNGTTKR